MLEDVNKDEYMKVVRGIDSKYVSFEVFERGMEKGEIFNRVLTMRTDRLILEKYSDDEWCVIIDRSSERLWRVIVTKEVYDELYKVLVGTDDKVETKFHMIEEQAINQK